MPDRFFKISNSTQPTGARKTPRFTAPSHSPQSFRCTTLLGLSSHFGVLCFDFDRLERAPGVFVYSCE